MLLDEVKERGYGFLVGFGAGFVAGLAEDFAAGLADDFTAGLADGLAADFIDDAVLADAFGAGLAAIAGAVIRNAAAIPAGGGYLPLPTIAREMTKR